MAFYWARQSSKKPPKSAMSQRSIQMRAAYSPLFFGWQERNKTGNFHLNETFSVEQNVTVSKLFAENQPILKAMFLNCLFLLRKAGWLWKPFLAEIAFSEDLLRRRFHSRRKFILLPTNPHNSSCVPPTLSEWTKIFLERSAQF